MNNVNDITADLSDDTATMSYDDYYYYSRQLDNIINNQNTIIQNRGCQAILLRVCCATALQCIFWKTAWI